MTSFEPFDLSDEAPETVALASRLLKSSIAHPVLDVLGDQWVLRILRELHWQPGRFDQLRMSLGISRGTLAARLEDLVFHGLIERAAYQTAPPRFDYRLTAKGRDTAPIICGIAQWDRAWAHAAAGGAARGGQADIRAACGHEFRPYLGCGGCKAPIRARDISYEPGPGAGKPPPSLARRSRRRSTPDAEATRVTAADILGDRWSALVMAGSWFGLKRFSDIERAIDIAPNILTRRLAHLTDCGIFARHIYQRRPMRAKYILTEKGFDFYPLTVALLNWGERWIAGTNGVPLILWHKPCGSRLHPTLYCDVCGSRAEQPAPGALLQG